MTEYQQTLDILNKITELFKEEKATHDRDVDRIWEFCSKMLIHHDEVSSSVHRLLEESERRVTKTNAMVHELSDTLKQIVSVNSELKNSYVSQFESARNHIEHIQEENARLMRENEAYYNALKAEQERNNKIMSSMINHICQGNNRQPLVNIDQK